MSYLHNSLFAVTSVAALALAACGGSSTADETQSAGGGGGTDSSAGSDSGGSQAGGSDSGGEGSGGDAAAGAGGASSGSGGASAAGGNPSEGSGGAGAAGGNPSEGTGGAGAEGGETSGGSGGAGDAGGTGGVGDAGTANMAGSGGSAEGGGYRPPQNQLDGCDQLCELEAQADCPNEDPQADCVRNCNFAIRFEPCSDDWDALFECVDAADEVECDDQGEASVVGCEDEAVVALACVLEDGISDEIEPGCSALCEAESMVECDASGSESDCTTGCSIVGSAFPLCEDQYLDYLDCGGDADIACNGDGEPEPQGCSAPFVLWLACLIEQYDVQL